MLAACFQLRRIPERPEVPIVIAQIADRVTIMHRGKVVESGPTVEVLRRPRAPYAKALIGAVPRIDAKLDRFPTVTASATASDSRASADQAPGVPRADRDGESYSVQADVSWELDLFGRVRRNVESQRAEAWAVASDLDALQVAIVGEVARSYVELRGLQERLRVARDNAVNQEETLRLVQARFDAGRGISLEFKS